MEETKLAKGSMGLNKLGTTALSSQKIQNLTET